MQENRFYPRGIEARGGGDGMEAFAACFERLEDPRTGNAGRHDLLEILMIALCTILCGGQTAVDMHVFGRAKEGFLRKFLKLEHVGHREIANPDAFLAALRLGNNDMVGVAGLGTSRP